MTLKMILLLHIFRAEILGELGFIQVISSY